MSITAAPSGTATDIDVLLIDDEPFVLTALAASLGHGGFSYKCAEHGRAALSLLTQHNFKLVVTDIHMPEMDGLEIIKHCHATKPALRILAISGGGRYNTAREVLKSARLMGSEKTLSKPFSTPEFLKVVEEMIYQ